MLYEYHEHKKRLKFGKITKNVHKKAVVGEKKALDDDTALARLELTLAQVLSLSFTRLMHVEDGKTGLCLLKAARSGDCYRVRELLQLPVWPDFVGHLCSR